MNGRSLPPAGSLRPARVVAAIGLVAGLAFMVLTPPLGGYDESVHFLRAYQVSQGGLIATHRGHQLGGRVPEQLRADLSRIFTDGLFAPHDRTEFRHRLWDRPATGPKTFVDFASAAVYSPVVYAPAAAAIAIGRLFGVSTLMLVYLGRLADLLVTVGFLTLAVRLMPTRAWMLATVALLPVTVLQSAMLSADGVTIALALLVLALALDTAATPRGEVRARRLVEIALATVALGFAKPPYILFALAFAIPWRRHGGAVARALVASVGAGLVATAAWGAYASSVYQPPRHSPLYAGRLGRFTVFTHVDPQRQERLVLHHPWRFVQTITHTLSTFWSDMLRETVAQLPLWRVPVAIVVGGVAIVAVGAAAPDVASEPLLGWRSRVLLVALAGVTFVALMLLAYVGWNAVGSPRIEAFQGRYLLPLVPLLLLALPVRRRERGLPGNGSVGVLVGLASAILLVWVWFGLRAHFY
jgi:uncharacterized membrane protein